MKWKGYDSSFNSWIDTLQWRHNGSQLTSITIVYSTVYSDADQRKHQSSASLAFVRGIHRGPVISPHKWPVTRKMFPFNDVIMIKIWLWYSLILVACECSFHTCTRDNKEFEFEFQDDSVVVVVLECTLCCSPERYSYNSVWWINSWYVFSNINGLLGLTKVCVFCVIHWNVISPFNS